MQSVAATTPRTPFAVRSRAAQALRPLAAPFRYVRPVTRHYPGRDIANVTPLERKLVGMVRAAVAVGAPGVTVTLDELVTDLGYSRATICRALERIDEHRRPCAGACERPGLDRSGRPLCRGCADPCPPGCTRHRALLRRVHQYVEGAWGRGEGEGQRRNRGCDHRATWRRRQTASVIVLGSVGRRLFTNETPKQDHCSPSSTVGVSPKISLGSHAPTAPCAPFRERGKVGARFRGRSIAQRLASASCSGAQKAETGRGASPAASPLPLTAEDFAWLSEQAALWVAGVQPDPGPPPKPHLTLLRGGRP